MESIPEAAPQKSNDSPRIYGAGPIAGARTIAQPVPSSAPAGRRKAVSMGRRQRGIRLLWSICWERDLWHPVRRGAKAKANRAWRKQQKRELAAEPPASEPR